MSSWLASRARGKHQKLLAGLLGLASSCAPHYEELPTYSAERHLLQVVVAMPAGTNQRQYFDVGSQEFRPVKLAGLEQSVAFLPSPGNEGFIPGTQAAAGTPLTALVLAAHQPAGTVQEVLPLGLLTLDDNGRLRQVIIATPARPSQQILPEISTWAALTAQYPQIKPILGEWYRHQGRPGEIRLVSWKDEQAAQHLIKTSRR